jgi:hypothetical protein
MARLLTLVIFAALIATCLAATPTKTPTKKASMTKTPTKKVVKTVTKTPTKAPVAPKGPTTATKTPKGPSAPVTPPASNTTYNFDVTITFAGTANKTAIEDKKTTIETEMKTKLNATSVTLKDIVAGKKFTVQATARAAVVGATIAPAAVTAATFGSSLGGFTITGAAGTPSVTAPSAPSAASALAFAQWIVAAVVVAVVATF